MECIIPREFEDLFIAFLEIIGCDNYGKWEDYKKPYADEKTNTVIDNETFTLRPYYWGDDEEVIHLPNFVYKPDNLYISWYKYPFRGAFSSAPINEAYLKKIIRHCIISLGTNP